MAHTPQTRATAYRKMVERRTAWFADNGPCRDCGSWDCLELHHRDPTQKRAHNVWSWSDAARMEELAKCDVLCEACHDAIHRPAVIHGRVSTYKKQRCRCGPCREAKRVETSKRRRTPAERYRAEPVTPAV